MTGVRIKQRESNLAEGELQWAIYKMVYKPQDEQTSKFVDWLDNNRDRIKNIFGDNHRLYIRPKTPEFAGQLAQYVVSNKIGDELEWIKPSDSDGWWLLIYGCSGQTPLLKKT